VSRPPCSPRYYCSYAWFFFFFFDTRAHIHCTVQTHTPPPRRTAVPLRRTRRVSRAPTLHSRSHAVRVRRQGGVVVRHRGRPPTPSPRTALPSGIGSFETFGNHPRCMWGGRSDSRASPSPAATLSPIGRQRRSRGDAPVAALCPVSILTASSSTQLGGERPHIDMSTHPRPLPRRPQRLHRCRAPDERPGHGTRDPQWGARRRRRTACSEPHPPQPARPETGRAAATTWHPRGRRCRRSRGPPAATQDSGSPNHAGAERKRSTACSEPHAQGSARAQPPGRTALVSIPSVPVVAAACPPRRPMRAPHPRA